MRAVDTNVLLRLMIGDDARQAGSAEVFIEDGAWVSILALAETIWVLATTYGRSATDVAAAIDMLLDHKNLTLQDSDAVAAALVPASLDPPQPLSSANTDKDAPQTIQLLIIK